MKKNFIILLILLIITGCTSVGIRYKEGYKESGIASWYGQELHGIPTAKKDEKFDMYSMTAAHRTIPFNSTVKVTNKENGKSVVVRINDRGPKKKERIIDMTYASFKKIADPEKGLIPVEIEIIRLGDIE